MPEVITDNLDLWSSALLTKSTAGRGSNGKLEAYGIKKLRALILEMAVRGKLVPQGENWCDTCLGDLGSWAVGSGFTKSEQGKEGLEILFAKVSDMNLPDNTKYIVTTNHTITETTAKKLGVNVHAAGTVIFPKIGGAIATNKRRILTRPTAIDNNCLGITPKAGVSTDWLYLTLSSINLTKYQAGTSVPALSQSVIAKIPALLPPLAEQHRIVAKVDELMALCDQLEQQQTHSIAAHQTLVETLLGTLTRIESQQEFIAAWARIASHFDTLFTTEASIDQLKQTILQLAVMGKLVPQDKNEESANVLLEKISEQKVRLVDAGEIRKQKALSNIDEEEKQFELPVGWKWCRLHEIVYLLGDGLHGTPEYTLNEKYYFVNGNNLNDGKIVIKSETKTVAQDQYNKYKKPLGQNSVLVSINGTLGNVAFYNNEAVILGKSACFFNLAEGIYKRFIKLVIDAPSFADYSNKNATGSTIKNLGLSAMNSLPIALPPKNEQHRIVAKVDELMSLCDALKARIKDAQAIQLHLADAIVGQAVC